MKRFLSLVAVVALMIMAIPTTVLAQNSGDAAGGFDYQEQMPRVVYGMLAAVIVPAMVSLIAKTSWKGYYKTFLNVCLSLVAAAGSWFVMTFNTNQYVIIAFSIFSAASVIFYTNKGGFDSLTENRGHK